MKNTFFKKLMFGFLLFLVGTTSIKAQDAKPDLSEATILCDKRTVTIASFVGAGVDTKEANSGCLLDLEEKNTTWFVWEAAGDPFEEQLLNFMIAPNQTTDQFGFSLFQLPNGLNDGTGKGVLRCAFPCQTGAIGLRDGDGDDIIAEEDCTTAQDGFMRTLQMTPGNYYGLMIENTTSDAGFSISFGGNGEFVGPVGEIVPDKTAACFGDAISFDGSISNITFANGNLIQYEWSFEDGDSITNRDFATDEPQSFIFESNGNKKVELTVTSDIGCTAVFPTNVTINDCCESTNKITIEDDPVIEQVACPSDANGSIDITVTNNNEVNFPTIYNWSNQATTEDLTMLSSDDYSVTVSNAAGCRDSATYELEIPGALSASDVVTPPSCGGGLDGEIAITATGGRTPYEYDLGNDGTFIANDGTFGALGIGDYIVVVKDASGCTDTVDGIELDEKQLNITVGTPVEPTCNKRTIGFEDNGAIEISADNAVGLLTFDFNDGNGPMDATSLTRLDSGVYTIDVFDSEGCTGNPVEFTLTEPPLLTLNVESSRFVGGISCTGANDGTAVVVASGGTPNYTYEWSTGSTNRNIADLGPGTYTVEVTDENGCIAEATTQPFEDPTPVVATIQSINDVTCSDRMDGSIVLDVSGGTTSNNLPYQSTYDGINIVDGTTISNLAIGDYTITITDNNGCPAEVSGTIKSPSNMSFNVSSNTDICYGEPLTLTNTSTFTQGNITSISWNINGTDEGMGDNVTINPTILGQPLATLTITTDLDCTETLTQELDIAVTPCCDGINSINTQPDRIEPSCNGEANGSIDLSSNVTSIPPIISYNWEDGQAEANINNLSAGVYNVTITNDATCTDEVTVTLEEPSLIVPTLDIAEPTCNEAANGEISVSATGGMGNYDFDLGNGIFTPNAILSDLDTGSYTIRVRDGNNCIEPIDAALVVPDGFSPITADLSITLPTCDEATNGSLTVNAIGDGIRPLLYDFGSGLPSTEMTLPQLGIGLQSVTIQDLDGCMLRLDTLIVASDVPPIQTTIQLNQPTCEEASNGSIRILATGNSSPFQYNFGNGFNTSNDTSALAVGPYLIQVQDADNCLTEIDTFLTAAAEKPIQATIQIAEPSCTEATNGSLTILASGDGAPFQYDFGDGFANVNSLMDTTIGNYAVFIRDADDCMIEIDTFLSVPDGAMPVQATLQIVQPSCGGATDGSVTVLPAGELGTDVTNYTYNFNGSGFLDNNVSDNLGNGQFSAVIRNANNCSIELDTVLNELVLAPEMPLVVRPTCFGLSDGSIRIDVPAPGAGPFTYNLNDGNGFQDETVLTNLSEGTYNIQIQDANLCLSEPLDVMVDQPDELMLSLVKTDISCFGENDGRIVATVTGGVSNYSYNWNNGQTNNVATGLIAGDYTLDVTDGNDCPISSDNAVTIIEPAELSAEIGQIDDVLCFGENNGAITVNPIGGSAPYEYSLDGIIFQSAPTLGNLVAGDYNIIVKDNRDCEITTSNATVAEPGEFTVDALVDNETTKLGFTINLSAEATTTATGGINYTWSTPDSIVCTNCERFETVPPGSTTYTVNAVNSDNCQASASVSVAVSTDRPIYFPNLFTPNGDGVHDEFYIPFSPAMEEIKEVKIFDRTGALVFEAFNIRRGEELIKSWDGEFNGTKLRQGVYVVTAQILFVDKQTLPYQSDITIITSE